jgi:hypothetical protein
METDIFIEMDPRAQDFLNELKEADSSAKVSSEEPVTGVIDLIRIALTVTPAVAFVIGRYLTYLDHKVLNFTIRDSDGRVIAARGDGADRLLRYFIGKGLPPS